MKNDEKQVLLDVKNLKKYFNVGNKKILKAVDDISLQIYKGETLGLVGESGCGKSTFGRTVIHLYDPTDGTVTFDGTKIDKNLDTKQRHELCRRMQMIFQDPFSSLNPAKKISWILEEPLRMQKVPKEERKKRVLAMAERVGLSAEHLKRRPHELSGGQRQRVSIAAALIQGSRLILADEPTGNLDSRSGKEIMMLLHNLYEEGNTIVLITHDNNVAMEAPRQVQISDGKIIKDSGGEAEYEDHTSN